MTKCVYFTVSLNDASFVTNVLVLVTHHVSSLREKHFPHTLQGKGIGFSLECIIRCVYLTVSLNGASFVTNVLVLVTHHVSSLRKTFPAYPTRDWLIGWMYYLVCLICSRLMWVLDSKYSREYLFGQNVHFSISRSSKEKENITSALIRPVCFSKEISLRCFLCSSHGIFFHRLHSVTICFCVIIF